MLVWIVFALVQIADVISTVIALRGPAREANPVIKWMMDHLGHGWIVVKLGIAALAAWLLWSSELTQWLWIANAVMALVILNNIKVIRNGRD